MPVLGSLLAGLSLPAHKVGSEASPSESSDAVIEFKSAWTSAQLAPIIQGTQKGASIVDISARLHELDEMSKRRVDVLEHFTVRHLHCILYWSVGHTHYGWVSAVILSPCTCVCICVCMSRNYALFLTHVSF